LVTGFGFLSGYLVRRAGARKRLLIWTAGIGRSVFIVLVPFLLLRMHVSQMGGITPARNAAIHAGIYGIRTAWHGPGDTSPVGHANLH
jgi:hypothetical protein